MSVFAAGERRVDHALTSARGEGGEISRMSNAAIPHPDERLINIDILGALRRRKWIGLAVAVLGVIATAWHLAYGFWLFAVDWGIVIGEKAQRLTLYGSIALAIVLSAVGINAAVAFVEPCGLFPDRFCEAAEQKKIIEPSGPKR